MEMFAFITSHLSGETSRPGSNGCVHFKPVPRRCSKESSFEHFQGTVPRVMLPSCTKIVYISRCSVLLTAITLLKS